MRCISVEQAQALLGQMVYCSKFTGRNFAAKLIEIENEGTILVFQIRNGAILRDARSDILLMEAF